MKKFLFIILLIQLQCFLTFKFTKPYIPIQSSSQRIFSTLTNYNSLKIEKNSEINVHQKQIIQQLSKITLIATPVLFWQLIRNWQIPPLSILLFLTAYLPCLVWGLPKSTIGSWKSFISNSHRIGGVLTLILPLLFTIWEATTSSHVSLPIYLFGIFVILTNLGFGGALIPTRIPAYDIPTVRAFAVGVLLGLSFTTLSLFFRFGYLSSYFIPGSMFAFISIYTVIYSFSDGLQHLNMYFKGHFKEDIGKKWYLPFEKSNLKYIFMDCLTKQPTEEALNASVSPANIVTCSTTMLTAIFAIISLLQVRYLWLGSAGMQSMLSQFPEIVRWSCYEALLAVTANNFGTFAGTLVLQNKVNQRTAGMFNAIGLMIPVMNVIGLLFRYPIASQQLLQTSFMKF